MADTNVTRRGFLGMGGATMLGGAVSGMAGAMPAAAESIPAPSRGKQQNLILFMPDELRADALACYGNPLTRTPNFDKLASGGTQFENCHVQYPICGPSRCSLLTGWPTSVRGHRSNAYFLRAQEPNMFRYLKQAGYDVFWYGKNDALATDSVQSSLTEWNYSDGHNLASAGDGPLAESASTTFLGIEGPDRRKTHEYAFIQAAIRVMSRKESDKPFCIFLPLSSPHPPYGPPKDFFDMYRAADMEGIIPRGIKNKPAFHAAVLKQFRLEGLPDSTFREIRARYYGMVSFSDWLLGELLAGLEKTGRDRDTAVMLLADHGDYAGDYGLVEKWPSGMEDQLTHVPLICSVPGGKAGVKVKDPVMLFDTMATCLELANTEAQHTHFARSLMPYVHGEPIAPRTATFTEGGYNAYEPQCFEPAAAGAYHDRLALQLEHPLTVSRTACVRTLEHKLVVRPDGESELYDHRSDPRELNNRFGDSALSAVQSELTTQLLDWFIKTSGVAPPDKDQRELPPYRPITRIPFTLPL